MEGILSEIKIQRNSINMRLDFPEEKSGNGRQTIETAQNRIQRGKK